MAKQLDAKNFYYDVIELVTKYRESGILDDELLDELEEVQLELKNSDYSPFETDMDDENFLLTYNL